MIPWLDTYAPFPEVEQALTEADGAAGLLAAGADLSPQRLLQAYMHGVFPWFSEGQPILWWSTDPRMVLFTGEFRLHRSLRKSVARFIRDRACATVTPALRRPIACMKLLSLVVKAVRLAGSICAICASGTHIVGEITASGPRNSGGMTPTISYWAPLMTTVRPTTLGSPPNIPCHVA